MHAMFGITFLLSGQASAHPYSANDTRATEQEPEVLVRAQEHD